MSRTLLPVLCLLCLLVLGCPAILARSHDTGEEASSGSGEGTTDEGSADAPDGKIDNMSILCHLEGDFALKGLVIYDPAVRGRSNLN